MDVESRLKHEIIAGIVQFRVKLNQESRELATEGSPFFIVELFDFRANIGKVVINGCIDGQDVLQFGFCAFLAWNTRSLKTVICVDAYSSDGSMNISSIS